MEVQEDDMEVQEEAVPNLLLSQPNLIPKTNIFGPILSHKFGIAMGSLLLST